MSGKEWFVKELIPKLTKDKNRLFIFGLALIVLTIVVWADIFGIVFAKNEPKVNFLNVGQGDSELIFLPANNNSGRAVKILIDGGPANGQILEDLARILPPTDRYIDLVVLSHPQLDHFGGLIEVLKRYEVGAFVSNGHAGIVSAYADLKNILAEKGIPDVVLAQNDKIQYGGSALYVLLPTSRTIESIDVNDTALVLELVSNNTKALFTGDISAKIEGDLLKFFRDPVDILKVAHHGSKFSSSAEFLNALRPKVAVIEVGKNTYGHPTPEVLGRLQQIDASVFRTDQSGNLELVLNGQNIRIFQENEVR